ncbi:hypothetical protein SO694_00080061 [Aureococcus anophagefferens]|uniref:Uncharacterized protein n=1 Tax=Aureococcus anophagefferens TaxID=44056 RepID=A0ABR1G4X5_AURAN
MKGSNSPKSRRPPKSPTSGVSFGRGETPSSPSVRFRDETQASLEEPGGGLNIRSAGGGAPGALRSSLKKRASPKEAQLRPARRASVVAVDDQSSLPGVPDRAEEVRAWSPGVPVRFSGSDMKSLKKEPVPDLAREKPAAERFATTANMANLIKLGIGKFGSSSGSRRPSGVSEFAEEDEEEEEDDDSEELRKSTRRGSSFRGSKKKLSFSALARRSAARSSAREADRLRAESSIRDAERRTQVRNLEAVEALGVGAGDYRQDGDLAAYTPEALTRRQRLRHDADVLRLMGAFFDALSETFEKVEKHAGKFTVFLNKGKHEAEKRREEKAADAVAAATVREVLREDDFVGARAPGAGPLGRRGRRARDVRGGYEELVPRETLFDFEVAMCKALFDPLDFDLAEVRRTVDDELRNDFGDAVTVGREAFYDSLFETVDVWAETCEAAEYASLLEDLHARVVEGLSLKTQERKDREALRALVAPALERERPTLGGALSESDVERPESKWGLSRDASLASTAAGALEEEDTHSAASRSFVRNSFEAGDAAPPRAGRGSDAATIASDLRASVVNVEMGFVPTAPPSERADLRGKLHGEAARRVRELGRLLELATQARFRGVVFRRFRRRWIRKLRRRPKARPPVRDSDTCPEDLKGLLSVRNVPKPLDPRAPPELAAAMSRVLVFAAMREALAAGGWARPLGWQMDVASGGDVADWALFDDATTLASSAAPAGAATAEACELLDGVLRRLGRRVDCRFDVLASWGLRVLADRRCPAIVERGDEPRLTYPCGVVGVGGVDVRHGYEFLATLAAAEHASTKQSYLFRGLTPFARAVLPKEFETAQRLGELSKPSTEGDSLGLFRGLEGTSVSSPQPSLELEDAILRTADDALAEARGALEGTVGDTAVRELFSHDPSAPRGVVVTFACCDDDDLAAGLAPPEVVVAHSPTPLVKLNELLDTSVDATFATFETRRVNWSEQLELGRVSPASRTPPRGRLEAGHGALVRLEYRGSSAYSVSQYRLDTAPGEPTASPPSRRLDSPREAAPARTKLEIALAVDPKLVEPVKTLSRVPTTPASPRG